MSAVQPFTEATRELLRQRLLEAVAGELRERAWADVTMAQVARAAGVSRQTVYNEFGSRGELAQAYVLWEAGRFLASVAEAVARHADDPVRALTAAFATFLDAAGEHPLVRELVGAEGGHELLPLVTTQGGPLHEQAAEGLGALIEEHWPQVGAAKAHLLADAVVRLAISHAAAPGEPPRVAARRLGELLGPFVERALAA